MKFILISNHFWEEFSQINAEEQFEIMKCLFCWLMSFLLIFFLLEWLTEI